MPHSCGGIRRGDLHPCWRLVESLAARHLTIESRSRSRMISAVVFALLRRCLNLHLLNSYLKKCEILDVRRFKSGRQVSNMVFVSIKVDSIAASNWRSDKKNFNMYYCVTCKFGFGLASAIKIDKWRVRRLLFIGRFQKRKGFSRLEGAERELARR